MLRFIFSVLRSSTAPAVLGPISLLLLSSGATTHLAPARAQSAPSADKSEILWDKWGVPHIYGDSPEVLSYGFGWSQMKSHGDAILRLYGMARGRGAEYWGEKHLSSDRLLHKVGIPQSGKAALKAQSPAFRRYLKAFAKGMNAYVQANPEAISEEVKPVLPVCPADILRHTQRVLFTFASLSGNKPPLLGMNGRPSRALAGSNSWAIGPSRSESGNAMMLHNPHLPWEKPFVRFYEAQLAGPNANIYGATFIGMPVIILGFNEHVSWSHTVNIADVLDTYRLQHDGDAYQFDGELRPFETESTPIKVRQSDGTMRADTIHARRSVHGPVVRFTDSTALAVRTPVLNRHGALEQWWEMGQSTELNEFKSAVQQLEIPMFTITYADREGQVYYLFGGQIPNRSSGDYRRWQTSVSGDTSLTLWSETHAYESLPKVTNPESGFVQNSNSPPWFATGSLSFDPSEYPAYMSSEWLFPREQRGIEMLRADGSMTFEELVGMRYSNRMRLPDQVFEDLLPAARASTDSLTREAARVLSEWDRHADAESRGAVLFSFWVQEQCQGPPTNFCDFEVPWRMDDPFSTPRGLAEPDSAAALLGRVAEKVNKSFGRLDVAWGEVMRLSEELPGNGAPGDPFGTFHVVHYRSSGGQTFRPFFGETWVAAVELTNQGPRGEVLLAYGNASQPGSPHNRDQLQLLSEQRMRPLWFTRKEVEAHLESRKTLQYSQRE